MSKTAYHISLKGYVGGYDFDRSTVDSTLAKNDGKEVNVGSLTLKGKTSEHRTDGTDALSQIKLI